MIILVCPECRSDALFLAKGRIYNLPTDKFYYCENCENKFNMDEVKFVKEKDETIKDAIGLYNK